VQCSGAESTVLGQSLAGKNVSKEAEDVVESRYNPMAGEDSRLIVRRHSVCCSELQSVIAL
jgi:hypothetical protein